MHLAQPRHSAAPEAACWWLSPEGDFYFCRFGGHGALADQLCLKLGMAGGEWALERMGWVKGGPGRVFFNLHRDPGLRVTVEQSVAMANWLALNSTDEEAAWYVGAIESLWGQG